MTKFFKIFLLILIFLNCKNVDKFAAENDEMILFKFILEKNNSINRLEGGKIEYFLKNYEVVELDKFKNSIIMKNLNIDTPPKNNILKLHDLNPKEFYNLTNLKVIYNDSLKNILKNSNNIYNKDSVVIKYDKFFRNEYIRIDYIYFNPSRTKAIINYSTGKPLFENGSTYLFEKHNNIWNEKKILFY